MYISPRSNGSVFSNLVFLKTLWNILSWIMRINCMFIDDKSRHVNDITWDKM